MDVCNILPDHFDLLDLATQIIIYYRNSEDIYAEEQRKKLPSGVPVSV